MELIFQNQIHGIKQTAIESFKEKDKHPSDILINDLCNSFLNSIFGDVILNRLK